MSEPNTSAAVLVNTTVKLDHWELGRLFAEWSNEEQYSFLHGAAHAFLGMGGIYALQLHYIGDEMRNNQADAADVKHFIHQLNIYINGDDS